ncbi:MAG: DUF1501 domain-containing protein [Planctomycetia bacterium]
MTDFHAIHRRTFLARSGLSLGGAALSGLLARDTIGSTASEPTGRTPAGDRYPGAIHPLHHPPKAKAVIFLCLAGGPSHLETFDHKPVLEKLDGQEMPESVTAGRCRGGRCHGVAGEQPRERGASEREPRAGEERAAVDCGQIVHRMVSGNEAVSGDAAPGTA